MSAYSSVLGVVVLLLHLRTSLSFPTFQACPVPCLCQRSPLLNCSSLGLTKTPEHIPPTAVSLNISHNALRSLSPLSSGHVKLEGLLHLWVGNNFLESFDLVVEKNESGTRTLSSGEQECMSWAPDLQLLSADRNHLKHLPRGLHCLKSLQILQVSYNQISEIGPDDLTNSTSLKELHLQHNHIRNIHSRAFIDLKKLQVLDLSYNHLATIPVPVYQSLRNLNALVNISFNRWKCDCNLQTLRRWISFDTEVGDASWQVVCDSPPHHAGKDLLHLKDSDLICPTREYSTSGHYHNMIVDEGTQILLSCSNDSQDFMQVHWWTPHGQVTDNQPELLIKGITEQHEGLYICVWGLQGEHISVFDLQVYTKSSDPRPRREAPIILDVRVEQENTNVHRNSLTRETRTQSEFVLAVCLSVFITFIVAFILGVLLRPLFDKLWRRIRSKRHSSQSPTTSRASSTGPQPHVNEGYSDAGDHERVVRVGSRVTFGGITEVGDKSSNVPYYVTAETVHSDGSSESNTEVEIVNEDRQRKEPSEWRQHVEKDDHRGRANSISSSTTQEGDVNVLIMNNKILAPSSTTDLELEPIPDANDMTQPKRKSSTSSSSSSSSSHSRQTLDRDLSSEVRESTKQSVDPPAVNVSVNKSILKDEIPRFTTEPFTEWPTGLTEQNVDFDAEFWNDSGESFSFNEESEKSSVRDLSSSVVGHPVNDDHTWRQGNIESPTNQLNFNSHVLIGREVSVDDVNQRKRSDTSSYSSSSESGDSEGPNSYTVNPKLKEESEIVEESYRKIDSDEFWTPEDAIFTEKSQPGDGIFIRQETITLDPSDIHLTFIREESVNEDMLMDESQRISGIWTDVSLDTVPKVKRYVQFTESKSSISPSSTNKNVTPETEVKSEAFPGEASYLTQTEVSLKEIPKVKRYIQFRQSEPHSPTFLLPPSSTKKDIMVETKRSSTSSEDEAKLTSDEEQFFRKTNVSSDGVPKVKRYIQFKQSEPHSPTLLLPPSSTKKDIMVETKRSSTSSEDEAKLTSEEEQFFRKTNVSSDGVPKVKTYIQFKQSEPHSPTLLLPPSSTKKEIIMETKRSSTSSEDEAELTSDEEQFFRKTNVSSDGVPKVKRYIQFKQSEPHSPTLLLPPSSTKKDIMVETKRSSTSSEDEAKLTSEEEQFFRKTNVSSDGVPKVKTYIQFKQSEPHSPTLLLPPSSTKKEIIMETKRSSTSSEDEAELTSDEEQFFRKTNVSSDGVPKVKRYIQFKQSEPHSPTLLLPPSSTKKDIMVETKRSSTSSEDEAKLTSDEEQFFRKTNVSSDGVPKVKGYIQFKQIEPSFPTLSALSPSTKTESTTTKDISPLTDQKKQFNSSNFSPEGLPLYHVHPSYKINQRLNKDSETDSQSPSEDEDQLAVYPRKLEIKTEPEINRGSITPVKNTVLNIDFDNSSSSTDVFEKKQVRGLARLKMLSTLLFNRHDNETEVQTGSATARGTGEITYPSYEMHSKFPEDTVQTTTNEDMFFGHIQSANQSLSLVNRGNAQAEFESRRSSLSSLSDEGSISSKHKEDIKLGQSLSLDQLPKVKRYLKVSYSDPHSQARLPSHPPTTRVVTPDLIVKCESRKSSSSSDDDVKQSTEGENFYGLPKIKRYIKFTHTEPYAPTQQMKQSISPKVVKSTKSRRSSSSSEDDIKMTQLEKVVETISSKPIKLDVKSDPNEKVDTLSGEAKEQAKLSIDKIPKVKRYINFKQSEPHSLILPSLPKKDVMVEAKRYSTSSEDEVELRTAATTGAVIKSLQSSSSSEDEVSLTTKENGFFGEIGVSLGRLPQVKRYLQFHPVPHVPAVPPTTTLKSLHVTPENKTKEETRKSSTSSEEDVKLSTKDEEHVTGETGGPFVQIPKVKRYIQFRQSEESLSQSPFPKQSIKVTETELREANTFIQPATIENKTESRRLSTSSEDDDTITATKDNFRGQTGTSLNRIPKVKRYIQFTHPGQHSPPQSTTAQSVGISVIQDTRRSSSLSIEDVKPSTNYDNSLYQQTDASFSQLPKVQRYIEFKQHEPFYPVNSSAMEDSKLNRLSVTSIKTYSTYKTKAETESSSSSSDESPSSAMKKRFALVVKTKSESLRSEFPHTGPKPKLQKSGYLSRDNRDLVGHVVIDVPPPQNDPPSVPQTPPPPLEQDDAREYLRDNSQARQRQERRRLFQQRKKEMDEYSITSLSSITQEGNKQDRGALVDYREATLLPSASMANTVPSRRTEEAPTLQGLKTKNISALRSSSPPDSANTKYKEFLI